MPHTLLLADDSITVQRVIELTFADEDIQVVAVGDGERAIAALHDSIPDIVLADIGMPGPNGYEVARYVKNTPRLAHVPVLLLAGAFEPVDAEQVATTGCQGVLTKPFEPQLVIARVKALLGTAGAPAASGPARAESVSSIDEVGRPSFVSSAASGSPIDGPTDRSANGPAAVERYFEQLDEAFAKLPSGAPSSPAFAPTAGSAPVAETIAIAAPASLAEAFVALLEAERRVTSVASTPGPHGLRPTVVASDAIIDEVVRRVLDRLSDRVVRETVSGLVLDLAERLVREEIERVKENARGMG